MGATHSRYPRGPRGWRLIRGLLAHRRHPLGFLETLAREYGDLVHFRLGPKHAFFVRHPDMIKAVLVTQQASFHKGLGLQWAKEYLGEGLLTSEDEFHHRQRQLIQPTFHRARLVVYGRTMSAYAAEMRNRWQGGAIRDVADDMRRLTLAIVGKTLLSVDVEGVADDVARSVAEIHNLSTAFYRVALPWSNVIRRLPLPSNVRLRLAVERLDRIVYPLISERRRRGVDREDLLSTLLEVQDETGAHGGMTDAQVRDEVVTMFLAGHETTANALTWVWYLLSQHPDREARLHQELASVLGNRLPGVDDLPRLPYTYGVMAEALRLYPPAFGLGRRAVRDVWVEGHLIPAGSTVMLSPFVTQRDPRFFPEPLRFDPERWTSPPSAARPEFAYFPFGGGARRCAGEQFAWMEGILVIATVAQQWRLRLVAGHPVEPQSMVVLRPKHGMRMRLERRLEA